MSDSNVHVGTHPSGHPNKTAVNAENPIFGRPAEPVVTEVSVEQAAIVQSDKTGRETVVSPLINEEQLQSPAEPIVKTKTYSDGTTATGVAPLPDLSPAQQDAAEAAQDSGKPSAADLDAVAGEQGAAEATSKTVEPASAEA